MTTPNERRQADTDRAADSRERFDAQREYLIAESADASRIPIDPLAAVIQGQREGTALAYNTLKDGNAVAVFIGLQPTLDPEKSIPLFNLFRPLGAHPVHSTVGAEMLERHGYGVPSMERVYRATEARGRITYLPVETPPTVIDIEARVMTAEKVRIQYEDGVKRICDAHPQPAMPLLNRIIEKLEASGHLPPTPVQQAAADLAHDEKTEGFSKRPFRINPHE